MCVFTSETFLFRKTVLKILPKTLDFLPLRFSYVPRFPFEPLKAPPRIERTRSDVLRGRIYSHFNSHIPAAISASAIITRVSLAERKHRQITAAANTIIASFALPLQHLFRRMALAPFRFTHKLKTLAKRSLTLFRLYFYCIRKEDFCYRSMLNQQ